MADYNVRVTVRNGLLMKNMRDFGHDTAASLSRETGINQTLIGELLNLKATPIGKNGDLTPTAKRLCEYFQVSIDELFPDEVLTVPLSDNSVERWVTSDDISAICNRSQTFDPELLLERSDKTKVIDSYLHSMTPRERLVISLRFGLDGHEPHDLSATGKHIGATRERVRLIEAKAMRRVRERVSEKHGNDYAGMTI